MSTSQLDPQYELLSKALAVYSDPKARPLAEKGFDTLGYTVNRVFDDPANEFQAVGLSSKDGSKSPVLVLPGGRAGNPRSVGNDEFTANKQPFKIGSAALPTINRLTPKG